MFVHGCIVEVHHMMNPDNAMRIVYKNRMNIRKEIIYDI